MPDHIEKQIAVWNPAPTKKQKHELMKLFEVTDDLKANSGLDTSLHASIIDYIKSRLLEDMGDLQRAAYYRNKYERTIKQYPHRKSGVRALSVPRL